MVDRERLFRDLNDARALLLAALEGMTDEDLGRHLPGHAWTVADLLHHITAWDEVGEATVKAMETGATLDAFVADVDAWNEQIVAARHGQDPGTTLTDLHAARERLRATLAAVPSSLWDQTRTAPGGQPVSLPGICATWTRHDIEHAAELRVVRDRDPAGGPQTS